MAKKNGKDCMYLIWKQPVTRRQYVVGCLSKNGNFEFEYGVEIEKAAKDGFKLLIAFDDMKKKYSSARLFPTFSSRVPDRRRKDIRNILNKYGLDEYDEYQLLKKSGGRLPIDSLEFIDPILDNGEEPIERNFYIAGVRHYIGCENKGCDKSIDINVGEMLHLELDIDNIYDKYAIKIINKNKQNIGYIPRYYSQQIHEFLTKGAKYTLEVLEVNKEANKCAECIRVHLNINRRHSK